MSGNKVRVFGAGIEPKGNTVGQPATFTVDTADAGKGKIEVVVWDPKGKQVKCDVEQSKEKKTTYTCVYTPQTTGNFKIHIYFGGRELPKSPSLVEVSKPTTITDSSKPAAKGPADVTSPKETLTKDETATTTKTKDPGVPPPSPIKPKAESDIGRDPFPKIKSGLADEPSAKVTKVFGPEPTVTSKPKTVAEPTAESKSTGKADTAKESRKEGIAELPGKLTSKVEPEFSAETKSKIGSAFSTESKADAKVEPQTKAMPKADAKVEPETKAMPKADTKVEPKTKVMPKTEASETEMKTTDEFTKKEKSKGASEAGFKEKSTLGNKTDAELLSKSEIVPPYKDNSKDDKERPVDKEPKTTVKAYESAADTTQKSGIGSTAKTSTEVETKETDSLLRETTELKGKDEDKSQSKGTPKVDDIFQAEKEKCADDVLTEKALDQEKVIEKEKSIPVPEKQPATKVVAPETEPPAGISEIEVNVGGLETPILLGDTRKLCVFVKDNNIARALCNVTMVTSDGKTAAVPLEIKTECYDFSMTPEVPGHHMIKIEYAGQEVPISPCVVDVQPIDISSVIVKGLETPIVLDENRPISVVTTGIGRPVQCIISVITPKGNYYSLPTFQTTEGHGTYFTPTEAGLHDVSIHCASQEVPGSPCTVLVEKKSSVVRGLESLLGIHH